MVDKGFDEKAPSPEEKTEPHLSRPSSSLLICASVKSVLKSPWLRGAHVPFLFLILAGLLSSADLFSHALSVENL